MLENEVESHFAELEKNGADKAVIGSLRQAFSRLSDKAKRDPKTLLYNAERLFFHLDEFLKLAADHDNEVSVLMADIDHFKQFNDQYGHIRGDDALKIIASTITGAVKQSDVVARYGGEEFAVALPQTGSAQALEIARKVRSRVENTIIPSANDRRTVSIGVFTYNVGLDELLRTEHKKIESGKEFYLPTSVINAADIAMYNAKQKRNCIVVYEPGMQMPNKRDAPSQGSEK